ncbi:MAG: hypothetical protein MZV70_73885 [Desulfobacterales bacterium]|nr:hypothetical protein [Desulfobacterales bacterium]
MHYRFKTGEETLTFGAEPGKENHLKVSTGRKRWTFVIPSSLIITSIAWWMVLV